MISSCSKLCKLGVRLAILDVCHTRVKQNTITNTNRYFTGHIPRKLFGGEIVMPVGQSYIKTEIYSNYPGFASLWAKRILI
jgi:hypothetical protein